MLAVRDGTNQPRFLFSDHGSPFKGAASSFCLRTDAYFRGVEQYDSQALRALSFPLTYIPHTADFFMETEAALFAIQSCITISNIAKSEIYDLR